MGMPAKRWILKYHHFQHVSLSYYYLTINPYSSSMRKEVHKSNISHEKHKIKKVKNELSVKALSHLVQAKSFTIKKLKKTVTYNL